MVSTPNGYDSLFYKIYKKTLMGETEFNLIDIHWFYDSLCNKNLIWSKIENNIEESYPEVDFIYNKMKLKYDNGWKPSSTWYENMMKIIGGDILYARQEYNGEFIRPE